jgi:uncharacterized membrane protein YeaQ/YmgE (transglycosylase-associated protein family)
MIYLNYAVYGFFVGILAKILFFSKDEGGIIPTIIIGMLGSMLSGYLLSLLGYTVQKNLSIWGLLPSILGALLLLLIFNFFKRLFFK